MATSIGHPKVGDAFACGYDIVKVPAGPVCLLHADAEAGFRQVAGPGHERLLGGAQLVDALRMHAGQREWYATRTDDAAKIVAIGDKPCDPSLPAVDVASLAGVINALLNYDETVVKR